MKGRIKKVGMTEKNEPIYTITTPKHLRRKLGRFIRQFNKSCIDPRHRFKKFPRSTETIVGIEGEKCSYYEGLSVIRFNDRVSWEDIEGSPKLKCQNCSFTTDSEDLLAVHIERAHLPDSLKKILQRVKSEFQCQPNCGHTEDEHIAFDLGVTDGEMGFEADPPFDDPELRGAWFSGHSVGMLNRIN